MTGRTRRRPPGSGRRIDGRDGALAAEVHRHPTVLVVKNCEELEFDYIGLGKSVIALLVRSGFSMLCTTSAPIMTTSPAPYSLPPALLQPVRRTPPERVALPPAVERARAPQAMVVWEERKAGLGDDLQDGQVVAQIDNRALLTRGRERLREVARPGHRPLEDLA